VLDDYFEEEEKGDDDDNNNNNNNKASAEVVITNNGQRNQPNCSAVRVLLMAKERAQCARCDVGLRVMPCFAEYHTKVNL
jgi:hypothetical protein